MFRLDDILRTSTKFVLRSFITVSLVYENNHLALYGGFSRAKCKKKKIYKKESAFTQQEAIL